MNAIRATRKELATLKQELRQNRRRLTIARARSLGALRAAAGTPAGLTVSFLAGWGLGGTNPVNRRTLGWRLLRNVLATALYLKKFSDNPNEGATLDGGNRDRNQ